VGQEAVQPRPLALTPRPVTGALNILREAARTLDLTRPVALRWLVQQPDVLPIPGAKTGRQAAQNAGAPSCVLTDPEVDVLSRATARSG
jgi:diketogulonate reductase-like aldo/keto reductase